MEPPRPNKKGFQAGQKFRNPGTEMKGFSNHSFGPVSLVPPFGSSQLLGAHRHIELAVRLGVELEVDSSGGGILWRPDFEAFLLTHGAVMLTSRWNLRRTQGKGCGENADAPRVPTSHMARTACIPCLRVAKKTSPSKTMLPVTASHTCVSHFRVPQILPPTLPTLL